ncbi:MAG TPA: hypothetical protein VLL52_17210, partial [Anaerolineae bacterium]|nr:hypothetical protein [Anaerolineae bacterium]
KGADAGNVVVNHTGTITSHGDDSIGIFAQSVGGGGGNGALSISSPIWMAADAILKTAIGGIGDATGIFDGKSGTVTVNSTGDIFMFGANSTAEKTQSINGGGGNIEMFLDISKQAVELGDAGFELPVDTGDIAAKNTLIELGSKLASGFTAAVVEKTRIGDAFTFLRNSPAAILQSIGGGGGSAAQDVVVNSDATVDLEARLGAQNTNNSSGGAVAESRTGNVATQGDYSAGSSTQSIGGGGGYLRMSVTEVEDEFASGLGSKTATVTLGADPSFTNNGGDLTQTFVGDTSTAGDMSPALEVQSIGAGGGIAKIDGMDTVEVIMGAQDNSTGDGGNINFTNTGNLSTNGLLSHVAVIQSIGGGGGFVLTGLPRSQVTVTPSAANGGNGGNINFAQVGNVFVGGDRSFGIFAQSLGGGGGLVDDFFADAAGGAGSSGAITINFDSNLLATGTNNIGIFAQSRALFGSQGNINISLTDNKTIQVNDSGIGVKISGGANNLFVNNGGSVIAASTLNHPDGYAVVGEEGNET